MKLIAKLLIVLILTNINGSCQQQNQLSIKLPQTVSTNIDINERNKIDAELKKAVENQDAEKIKELSIQVKEPVPIIKAIKSRDVEKVEELLKQGANPNAFDWWFWGANPSYDTALGDAIDEKNKPIIELLLQYGADINKVSAQYDPGSTRKGWNYNTALHAALFDNSPNLEVVQILVAHGASIKNERNVLHLAPSLTDYLINNGADINQEDEQGNTILTYWWVEPDLSTLEYYLKKGANPYLKNKNGKNAFDAVRENKLLSTEVYSAYIPEQKNMWFYIEN